MLIALSCMTVWYAVLFPDRFEFAPCSCHRTRAKTNSGFGAVQAGLVRESLLADPREV
jgi:hypothetical protein